MTIASRTSSFCSTLSDRLTDIGLADFSFTRFGLNLFIFLKDHFNRRLHFLYITFTYIYNE